MSVLFNSSSRPMTTTSVLQSSSCPVFLVPACLQVSKQLQHPFWMVLLLGFNSLREFLFFSMGGQLALQIRGQVLFDFVLLFFVWPHMNSTADLYAMSKQIKVLTVVSALSHNIIVTSDWAWRNNGEHIYKGPISDMSPWSVLLQHHETIDRDIMKEQSVKSNMTVMWPHF